MLETKMTNIDRPFNIVIELKGFAGTNEVTMERSKQNNV
jgi:hypothetical protein